MAPAPGPFPPPTGPFPPPTVQELRNVLSQIPAGGITIDDFLIKFFKGTVPDYVKQGVIKELDPIASFDAATGLWKPRPRYPPKPGYLYQMISRPRKRKRVSPFSSQWISETGETITHVRGDYNPVWQRYHGCMRTSSSPFEPALFAFLDIHKTVTKCGARDCLTCSLADLAAESMKPVTFTIDRVLHFFYDVCEKVFWGPRARAKRRVGPLANLHGDRDHRFLLFLLYNMREQLVRDPSDLQEFERLFMLEENRFMTCSEGHVAKSGLFQRFELDFGNGTRTPNDPLLDCSKLDLAPKTQTRSTMSPPCPFCASTDACTLESSFLRMPEILIIQCPLRLCGGQTTWEEFAYRVNLEEEIFLRPGDKERYVLVGATLATGTSWNRSVGHLVAAVRAPTGNIVIVDENNTLYDVGGPRWSVIEGRQSMPDVSDVLLPQMLIYRRKYEPPPVPPSYPRGSVSADPSTEKAVVAMKLALPHIDIKDLLWEYHRADENIQNTVDYILTGRRTEIATTLDQVLPGYLEDVIQAYVRYPQFDIKHIYETIQNNHGNFDYALKQLEDLAGGRINFTSSEFVGGAGLELDVDVINDIFIDGQAHIFCKNMKIRKTARLFGILVDPKVQHPSVSASSPRQSPSQSPKSPTRRSPRQSGSSSTISSTVPSPPDQTASHGSSSISSGLTDSMSTETWAKNSVGLALRRKRNNTKRRERRALSRTATRVASISSAIVSYCVDKSYSKSASA